MERNVVLIALFIVLFTAMIAALGLSPKLTLASGIPITAQSMGVMLCGTVLGAKRGALSVLLFLLLVAAAGWVSSPPPGRASTSASRWPSLSPVW